MGSSANKWEDKSNFEEKSEWPIIGLHVLEGGVAYTLLPAHLKELWIAVLIWPDYTLMGKILVSIWNDRYNVLIVPIRF